MLKLVINSPKGGVGKTTIATNAVLLLASEGKKVLALDLAGGLLMSKYIRERQAEDQEKYQGIDIREDELGELPISIKGGRAYDVMVADTDDYYKILDNLVDPKRRGWRAIAPILPDDAVGLKRISEELGVVSRKQLLAKEKINLIILPNRCGRENSPEEDINKIRSYLEESAIAGLMSQNYISNASSSRAPIFVEEDSLFYEQLKNVMLEIGVI